MNPQPLAGQVGRLLRTEREERGWSKEELCRRATARSGRRFHAAVIGRYEVGTTMPDLEQCLVLFGVLGIPLSALTEPRPEEPWLDGSVETLEELEDLVVGRAYVENIDLDTGLREVMEVVDPEGGLGELPEIAEEDR